MKQAIEYLKTQLKQVEWQKRNRENDLIDINEKRNSLILDID